MRLFLLAVALLVLHTTVSAQGSYHVVIGAFESEENAKKLCDNAHTLNVWATYSFNPEKKIFYVFVRNTRDRDDAYATLKNMQIEGFRDAWVFRGVLTGSGVARDSDPEEDNIIAEETDPTDVFGNEPESEPQQEPEVPTESDTLAETHESQTAETTSGARPAGKPFVFKLVNESTGAPVTGLVRLQEAERSNQFRPYSANETVYLVPPNNRTGRWYVTCLVVGYRLYKKPINYNNPEKDGDIELGPQQEIIFPVKLDRVRRGDYIEMDEVKFFSNASVLTPESKRELTELLAMMQENPDYKIRLHGHTNGNDGREIIDLGKSTEFFALNSLNERRSASAKELSTLRAETIKKYLEASGIAADRVAVKGEGGKQPIFDPKGTHASGNDRVEVEITRH